MNRLIAIVLCALLSAPAAAQLVSKRAFTQQFAQALRAQAPGIAVTITADMELEVKRPSGIEATVHLDNAYAQYSADPKARSEVIQRYVRSLLEHKSEDAPLDRARIVPVVKDRAWLAEVRQSLKARGAKQPLDNVFESLNDDLVVVYAEDSPLNIRYLVTDNLAELGLRKDQLRSLAVGNLRSLLPPIEVNNGPLVSMITAGGDYEASLLLFEDLWSSGRLKVDGDTVVAIPSRDVLLYTGSRNRAGVAKLRKLASELSQKASYSLTDRLFVYRKGKFERFD